MENVRYNPRISVELVPRSLSVLDAELDLLCEHFPFIDTVNIVDLSRLEVRSPDACTHAKTRVRSAIPHLRANSFNHHDINRLLQALDENTLHEVLVISGDVPSDMRSEVYRTSSLQLIRAIKGALPHVEVYAALDPYRQSMQHERDYALEKLEAGASALFTQPFFDLRLMEIYSELLPSATIYWGVTTVTSKKSYAYWESRNHAIFPQGFEPTLTWSRDFARKALDFAQKTRSNLYFMPIKTDTLAFLEGIISADTCAEAAPA